MRSGDVILILDVVASEDPCFLVDVLTPVGVLQILGEIEIGEAHLVVRDLHIGGDVHVTWGWSRLRRLGRVIAEKLDVDYIEIRGAVRTTGANPGRRPGVVRLSRPAQPEKRGRGEHA